MVPTTWIVASKPWFLILGWVGYKTCLLVERAIATVKLHKHHWLDLLPNWLLPARPYRENAKENQ